MSNLARPMSKPSSPKTRVVLLRQPVKSVRGSDQPDPLALQLALGVIIALGVSVIVFLFGLLGHHLGFAASLGTPDLDLGLGATFALGVRMLIDAPFLVFAFGLAEPLWLLVMLLMLAIPGGGLAGVRHRSPGGPKPSRQFVFFTWLGAIAAALAGLLAIVYAVSPWRTGWLAPMPDTAGDVVAWLGTIDILAGLDLMVLVSAALWMVLAMRLQSQQWMRVLSVVLTITGIIFLFVGTCISVGTATQWGVPRVANSARSTLAPGVDPASATTGPVITIRLGMSSGTPLVMDWMKDGSTQLRSGSLQSESLWGERLNLRAAAQRSAASVQPVE